MTTLREEFEAWYREQMADDANGPGALSEWLAYQAATERAARICDSIEDGAEFVGDTGAARGAEGCAAAIRGNGGGV